MAKERNIDITMDSIKRNGRMVSVLLDGKNEIGSIEPVESKFSAFLTGSADAQNFKTEADAVNYLLSAYHLHKH